MSASQAKAAANIIQKEEVKGFCSTLSARLKGWSVRVKQGQANVCNGSKANLRRACDFGSGRRWTFGTSEARNLQAEAFSIVRDALADEACHPRFSPQGYADCTDAKQHHHPGGWLGNRSDDGCSQAILDMVDFNSAWIGNNQSRNARGIRRPVEAILGCTARKVAVRMVANEDAKGDAILIKRFKRDGIDPVRPHQSSSCWQRAQHAGIERDCDRAFCP